MTTEHDSSPPDEASDGMDMAPDSPERGAGTLMRMLEHAREQRGSPSLWDAVAARLDSEERQREVVAPMLGVLDRIRERVDDETWKLILDFEWRSAREVMAGVEVGLELGYDHGRAATLVGAEGMPSTAASILAEKLADLVGDSEAEYLDLLLALVAGLRTTVVMAHGKGVWDESPAAVQG